jgi:dolichol-phosphate mannosyltransferase
MAAVQIRDCTLVIPAYNEERRIYALLGQIDDFGGKIIFVCDGDDRTAVYIKEYSEHHPESSIRCLSFAERLGKGGGVIAGMRAAQTPYVGFMDADGSTSPAEMVRLFSLLYEADGVIASRWLADSVISVRQDFVRRMVSRGFNAFTRVLFSLPFHDTQCGAKVFLKTALDAVLPEMRSTGFEFDVELLWRLRKAGFNVREEPTVWENRSESSVMVADWLRMLLNLLQIRFL